MSRRKPPSPTQPERGKWPLNKLRPHPRQGDFFDDLSLLDLEALAANMRDRGLEHPVEILPDGVILRGHQRFKAAQSLGWETIDVQIRHDLVGQSKDVVIRFLIEDNLVRRQLGPLTIARCYQVERAMLRANGGRPRGTDREDLRDRLAKRYGRSGRQIDRYARLLALPRALQAAVDRGELPVSTAEKALKFSAQELQKVVKMVEAGESPKSVVERVVKGRQSDGQGGGPLADLVFHFGRGLRQFHKLHLDSCLLAEDQRQLLVNCKRAIDRMLAESRSPKK